MPSYRFVDYLWDDTYAGSLDPLNRLVYRSNLLGADQRITNTGGGNTSAKLLETDPLTGAQTEVLWIKGSGGDLRTAQREHFASLDCLKLEGLCARYSSSVGRGYKSKVEDDMVGLYPHCTFNLNSRAPSIDTPLHAFLPGKHVDHMHPNAIIAVAASANSEPLTKEIFGSQMAWIPWMRPGVELGLAMRSLAKENPETRAVMMAQHGFISWADDDKECYSNTLQWIERASSYIESKYEQRGGHSGAFGGALFEALEPKARRAALSSILPWMRGKLSQERRMIGTIHDDETILRFVNSADAPRLAALGTSCPDHFLRTKIKPLFVKWNPHEDSLATLTEALADGLETYGNEYRSYYEQHKKPGSPPMRDPKPTVILIPGLGMVAWGRNKSESRVTAEFYNCNVEVMRGAEAIDRYVALPAREAFDIEYWALEEAKLRRMPPEKELAGQVAVVVGSGSGIGRQAALRLAREGAHVACCDLDQNSARATADMISKEYGQGIGFAGTGPSGCGAAFWQSVDITKRGDIRRALDEIILAYGGIDAVCVTAGMVVPSDPSGRIPDNKWADTYSINVTGSYLVADEAARIWREQMLPGSLVLTTSANAIVPKRGSVAYDTSKAAANHLVRELAIELAPLVRVNGVAPATVVRGSAMFPRERLVGSLAKYNVAFGHDESSESLMNKLAQFYAERTLTKSSITLADVAEACFLLVGLRLGKTTGQILAVDGGLVEAFLR